MRLAHFSCILMMVGTSLAACNQAQDLGGGASSVGMSTGTGVVVGMTTGNGGAPFVGMTTGNGGGSTVGMTTGNGGAVAGMTTGSGGGSSTVGMGGASGADSIAVLDSSVPSSVDTSAWLKAGQTLDPSTLVIVVDSLGDACASAHFDEGFVNHQLVVVGLPSALQAPGTYSFSSSDVIAWGSTWLTDGMGNGGGGRMTLATGSIQVESITASEVVFELASLPDDYTSLTGKHTAARCP